MAPAGALAHLCCLSFPTAQMQPDRLGSHGKMPCSLPSTAASLPPRLSPHRCHNQLFPKVPPAALAPPGRSELPMPSPAAACAARSPGCSVQQTGRVSCRQQSVPGDRIGLDVSPDCCSAMACGSPKGRAPLAYQGWASQSGAEERSCTPRPRCADGAALERYLLAAPDAMGRGLCARNGGCDL